MALPIFAGLVLASAVAHANPEPIDRPTPFSSTDIDVTGDHFTFYWAWDWETPDLSQLRAYRRELLSGMDVHLFHGCHNIFSESDRCPCFLSEVDESVTNATTEVCTRQFSNGGYSDDFAGICGEVECVPLGTWRYEFHIGKACLATVVDSIGDTVAQQCVAEQPSDAFTQPDPEAIADSLSDSAGHESAGCAAGPAGEAANVPCCLLLFLAWIGWHVRRGTVSGSSRSD